MMRCISEVLATWIVYNMSIVRCSFPTSDRNRIVESFLYPISVLPSCRLRKTLHPPSKHFLTRTWSMLNLTLNLASQETMSSSPPLGSIHTPFEAMIFMCFSIVILIFDTLLTLPSEIKYIWGKKRRLGSVLYVLARYPVLAIFLIDIYLTFGISFQVSE